ncbi:MAG TPA: hypothetical protein VEL11_00210 [Candidatus Bathyarchaeia archaeon]|nr:hypothetical protein [Candidatus Bathyarchaeia archaeon]
MYLSRKLLIFSILEMRRALIMLTLVGVIQIACTQTAFSQLSLQKQIVTCDQPGHPSCYSLGYAAGLMTRGTFSSCSNVLLHSLGRITYTIVVNNYCSGFSAAVQQQQQQQKQQHK